MISAPRPRRSMLYMPASNSRALEKAKALPADGLIFDLEDSVAPDAKSTARMNAFTAARSKAYGQREVLIRINGLDTAWAGDDLAAVAGSGADGIVLPKVGAASDVRTADDILRTAGAPDSLQLWAMIETPRGVLNIADIAKASPRLAGFCAGTADLAKDLHCAHPPDRAPMLYMLQLCVMVARAHNLTALDGVHFDLENAESFAAVCRQGSDLGFDGKTLIHPKQIETANRIFGPSPERIAEAQRIIAAHRAAESAGGAMTVLDGKLVEKLHVNAAERLLRQAEAIAALEADIPPSA